LISVAFFHVESVAYQHNLEIGRLVVFQVRYGALVLLLLERGGVGKAVFYRSQDAGLLFL
jgi:hypothetical protein